MCAELRACGGNQCAMYLLPSSFESQESSRAEGAAGWCGVHSWTVACTLPHPNLAAVKGVAVFFGAAGVIFAPAYSYQPVESPQHP